MQPPGPRGAELARSLWKLRSDPLAGFMEVSTRYGDVTGSKLPGIRAYFVYRPDLVEQVLVTEQDVYAKGRDFDLISTALGRGLLTSSGELWRRQRRLVQPMFAKRHMEPFAAHITAAGNTLLDDWEHHTQVDVAPAMMELTLDVVGRALFGADLTGDVRTTVDRTFRTVLQELTYAGVSPVVHALASLPGMDMRRALVARPIKQRRYRARIAELDALVSSLITSRRAAGASEDDGDMLGLLLTARDAETGESIGDGQIRDEIATFLVAGHETTAVTLAWMWRLLSLHPDAGDRVRAEADEVLGDRTPTLADADALVYTRAVIQESMRLYPPVWTIPRNPVEDLELDGYKIKAGSTVMALVYATHHDARSWPDPERFDPGRFLPGAPEHHRYAYLPFGAGRRVCVGQTFALVEAVLLTAMISRRFTLELEDPATSSDYEAVLTMRPRGGLPMRLVSR